MAQNLIHQIILTGADGEEQYELTEGVNAMGRDASSVIVLNDRWASRHHAQLECTGDVCTITDISANGTKVNGQLIKKNSPLLLNSGDIIEIGPFTLAYQQTPVALPEPKPFEVEKDIPEIEVQSEQAAVADTKEEQDIPPEPELEEEKEIEMIAPPPVTPPPAPPQLPPQNVPEPGYDIPPGLCLTTSRYLQYLPGIYHTEFMGRFLAMFESIYGPIEWNVENFDMFLDPQTAPAGFLPWLAQWFDITFDNSWSEEQRRLLLREAHMIYAARGTKRALSRVLEIYTKHQPDINDLDESLEPFTFTVTIPVKESEINTDLVTKLINEHKPAYTNYMLKFEG